VGDRDDLHTSVGEPVYHCKREPTKQDAARPVKVERRALRCLRNQGDNSVKLGAECC
jgi:hypothetical protein